MPEPVRQTRQMLAQMNPRLDADEVVFCTTADEALAEKAQPLALGAFREAEGVSLILPRATAEALGFPVALPMRRIELTVHSALDGIGLTAAVASALAERASPATSSPPSGTTTSSCRPEWPSGRSRCCKRCRSPHKRESGAPQVGRCRRGR